MTVQELKNKLKQIDRKSYGMYKGLAGSYDCGGYELCIDHVQGDPFAAPSRVRLCIPQRIHGFPAQLYDNKVKKLMLEDYLLRQLKNSIYRYEERGSGSGKSGVITTCYTGQEVLERIAVVIDGRQITARIEIGFPARGRTIMAGELEHILCRIVPEIVEASFYYKNQNKRAIQRAMELAENQESIRTQLKEKRLTAFIANGSILPRESGISQKPMKNAVPFQSPKSMEVMMKVPYGEPIKGMGIPEGITVIVGGGYHGKSTLLKAVETGVYNHIPGDGREYVITEETALKIRAEDGRYVRSCDISPFISNLPGRQDTTDFTTLNASGSTSQAANVIEGIESGAKVFLIDEDTTATNFMIRDQIMGRLVADEKEPITPFIRKIRALYEQQGISTIIVVGSSGDYLAAADRVIQLDCYQAKDVTKRAKEIAVECLCPECQKFPAPSYRKPFTGKMKTDKYNDYKIKTGGKDTLVINKENIDLRYVEQIMDGGQVAALGAMMRFAFQKGMDGRKTKNQVVDMVYEQIERQGFASIIPKGYPAGHPAMPRRQELYCCLNRWRRD